MPFIKLMSWNLLQSEHEDNQNAVPAAKSILRLAKPDILLAQETDNFAGASFVEDVLGEGWETYWEDSGVHDLAVFWRTDLFEKVSTVAIDTVASSNLRDVLHVVLKSKENGHILNIFNVHLKSGRNKGRRKEEIDKLLSLEEGKYLKIMQTEHAIIGGDFNVYDSFEPAYQALLTDAQMVDVGLLGLNLQEWKGQDRNQPIEIKNLLTQSTRSVYRGRNNYSGLDDRFDMILVSNELHAATVAEAGEVDDGDVFEYDVMGNANGGDFDREVRFAEYRHASDHLPVVCRVFL